MHKNKLYASVAAGAVGVMLGIFGLTAYFNKHANASVSQQAPSIASVNGENVFENELLFANGSITRAEAVDQFINATVYAQEAKRHMTSELNAAVAVAVRDVLARGFIEAKAKEISGQITKEEMEGYYKNNLSDAMFNKYKIKFKLAQQKDDIDAFLAESIDGKPTAKMIEGMQRLQGNKTAGNDNGEWLLAGDLPYNMGPGLVAGMKKGEMSAPMMTRDGFIVVYLEDIDAGKTPALGQVENDIRRILTEKKLSEALVALRKKADIKLR